MSGKPPRLHLRRIIATVALLALLLLVPLPAGGGIAWDAGIACGYLSCVFAVVLYIYPLRGRDAVGNPLPHTRLLAVKHHRRFGWIALTLGAAHTLALVTAQPLTLYYFLPSAPIYMLCGTGALVVLGILIPTGLSTRKSIRRHSPSPFNRTFHSVLASLVITLLGGHLLGSGQLVDTPAKSVALSVLLALPVLWTASRARWTHASGRYWTAALAAAVSCIAVLSLSLRPVRAGLLEPAARPDPLPVNFPHERHTSVNCVTCHHNFRDTTGTASCIDCHRSGRADLPAANERTFHVFCRECHHDLALRQAKHGPTRECRPCHR